MKEEYIKEEREVSVPIKVVELLLNKNPDALALLMFYKKNAAIQHTNRIWNNENFSLGGLTYGKDRLKKAKQTLLECGLIEEIEQRTQSGKFQKKFIFIKYEANHVYVTEPQADLPLAENPLTDKPLTGKPLAENQPQMLNTKKEMLNTKKDACYKEENALYPNWQNIVLFFYKEVNPNIAPPLRFIKTTKPSAIHLLSMFTEEEIYCRMKVLASRPHEIKFISRFEKFCEKFDSFKSYVDLSSKPQEPDYSSFSEF
jgi:hypothetical protein